MTRNWRKGNCVEVGQADWRKSSYSGGSGNCVEAGQANGAVLVRDTRQDANAQAHRFTPDQWREFVTRIKANETDR